MPSHLIRTLHGIAALLALALLAPACDDDCRFHPEHCHDGQAGAFCDTDADCRGVCCTEKSNCASGM